MFEIISAQRSVKTDFTKFDIPFIFKAGWTPTVKNNLMLAIVASSSKDGDHYKGALGSRLVVDHLSIIPK